MIETDTLYAQKVKAGYPPRTLTLIPELPIDSLGIKGEQLTVNAKPGVESSRSEAPSSASATGPMTGAAPSQVPLRELSALSPIGSAPSASASKGPDYVEFDGGYLVHQVSKTLISVSYNRWIEL